MKERLKDVIEVEGRVEYESIKSFPSRERERDKFKDITEVEKERADGRCPRGGEEM